ncbi:MAG: ubiquinone/menaquinone biosynthesis methyltransferase [Candidatus Eisenbacteria bacterium]
MISLDQARVSCCGRGSPFALPRFGSFLGDPSLRDGCPPRSHEGTPARPPFRRRFLNVALGLRLWERLVPVGLSARAPRPRDENACLIQARHLDRGEGSADAGTEPRPDGAAALGDGGGALERQRTAVREMFDRISGRYDLLNRILSLGLDVRWRREAVRRMRVGEGGRVLDVACGTGDLSIEAARAVPGGLVLGIDFSTPMLRRAREKAAAAGAPVLFAEGAAERLPVRDRSFDASGIAFGIRNVPDRARAIREMARAVRPGGRVVVLDLAAPAGGIEGAAVRFYLRRIVPLLGGSISSPGAYRYLAESMSAFPPPETFRREMEEAGLVDVSIVRLPPSPAWILEGALPR